MFLTYSALLYSGWIEAVKYHEQEHKMLDIFNGCRENKSMLMFQIHDLASDG